MSSNIRLSDALANILEHFEPHTDVKEGSHLSHGALNSIVMRLRLMTRLASLMEQELDVYRLVNVAHTARRDMDDLATEALTHLVLDPDGKVIKPNFGRKP